MAEERNLCEYLLFESCNEFIICNQAVLLGEPGLGLDVLRSWKADEERRGD